MTTFLITAIVIMLALGSVSYLSSKRTNHAGQDGPMLSLLPGDIKYESPSGRFRFYFPITTSLVISIVLTLVLWLLSSATAFCWVTQLACARDSERGMLIEVA